MKNRKSNSVNLSIGLLISLSMVFIAFEWSNERIISRPLTDPIDHRIIEDDFIPVPILEAKRSASAVLLPKHPDLTRLEIVNNDEPLDPEDEMEVIDGVVEQETLNIKVEKEVVVEGDHPRIFAEHMPQFPGGEAALLAYLGNSIRYPTLAIEMGAYGRVFVKFVVEKDGSVSMVEILQSADQLLDEESLRVVRSMPKWIPGKQNGKPVRVRMSLPVNFVLN